MSYRKVLIIRLSALGDVAMTIPVVYSVCRAYPETTFVMLTQKVASQLFINAPRNYRLSSPMSREGTRALSGFIIWLGRFVGCPSMP